MGRSRARTQLHVVIHEDCDERRREREVECEARGVVMWRWFRDADPSYLYKVEPRDVIDADTLLLDIDRWSSASLGTCRID